MSASAVGQDGQSEPPRVRTSRPIANGYVFINGSYLQTPYTLKLADGQLSINDEPITIPAPQITPKHHAPGFVSKTSTAAEQGFRQLQIELRNGNVVCLFPDQPQVILGSQNRHSFLTLISDTAPSDEMFQRVEGALPAGLDRQVWNDFLRDLRPSSELLDRAVTLVAQENELIAEAKAAYASTRRGQTFTYLLTVFGMVMAVYATGHLLQWQPPRGSVSRNSPEDDRRSTVRCLLLVVVLSALDLTWTYLAAQQGSFYELNPLGSHLLSSPLQLVLFKSLMTAGAVGLLIFLRQHQRAQTAAWWICLICTMLTMRWLTFNSMFVA